MLNVPFNDASRFYNNHRENINSIVTNVLDSGFFLQGSKTKEFATSFAEFCGTTFCLPVANGTDALEISLRASIDTNIQNADSEVIIVGNAGGYSSIVCRLVGVTPVYADIELESQQISIASVANCLGPKVKAIIVTHLYGVSVDVMEIRKMLDKKGFSDVMIIEDCAQAHGAKINGKAVGSLGDIAAFSFYPTKNLGAMGDAGAVVSSNEKLFIKARSLASYGWSDKYYVDRVFGRNSRIDEVQAALLNFQLIHLEKHNEIRRDIYKKYIQSTDKLIPITKGINSSFVGHLAVFRVDRRQEFIEYCNNNHVNVAIHYPILDYKQKAWYSLPHRTDVQTQMMNSEKSVNEVVSLPCFPYLTNEEIEHVCNILSEWDNI